ncbi:hypothetical protein, partial [Treponema sp.]|uniref:hypothetical protein n=1 Tax=Treponema sp. TaxID=166 RepID=UPI002600B6FD
TPIKNIFIKEGEVSPCAPKSSLTVVSTGSTTVRSGLVRYPLCGGHPRNAPIIVTRIRKI